MLHHIYPMVIFLLLSGAFPISGGQDDFFTLSPHLLQGIDVSQVQDIDHVDAIELPTVTDSSGKPLFTGLYSGPYFDLKRMTKNQTAQVGENALIHCAVKQSGKKSVSWIRKSDSYILSVDSAVFISDNRFKILRPQPGTEWNLHIKYVHKTDEGSYECQISTEPKMSFYTYLKVIVPVVTIEGSPDIHAQAGSSVTLKCSISEALQRPKSVKWYRDGTPLSEDWQIVPLSESSKDFSSKNKKKLFTFESLAILARVDSNHSGQYECHPDKLEAVSVNLHVVKGGTLAAMSDDRNEVTSGATGSQNCATMSKFVAFLWSWLMFLLYQSTNDDV